MGDVNIKWKTKESAGKIRKLNGGNLAPPIAGEMAGRNIRKSFKELNLAFTRLHDAPLDNANCPLVDIHCIFPLFHLDADDPRNYCFKHTDDYLHNCIVEAETPVFWRLGESIDHTVNKYFIEPPADVDKWIDVASNIIRHYTEGLWNGFHYNIEYWEIWNEPECGGNTRLDPNAKNLMWLGTEDEFFVFFAKVAKELKKRFPHLKFGGPAHCGWNDVRGPKFLEDCAAANVPLDFYSYHCYFSDPYTWIQESPGLVRKKLDELGYTKTEIHLNEWHYFPGNWHRLRNDATYKQNMYNNEMKGLDAAAAVTTVMSLWQDTPLDYGAYYTCTTSAWGCYVTGSSKPTPSYFGLKAFGDIVRYPNRTAAETETQNVTLLGGKDDEGNMSLLVSAYNTGDCNFIVTFDKEIDPAKCQVLLLDENHYLSPCLDAVVTADSVSFTNQSNSAVALVKVRA